MAADAKFCPGCGKPPGKACAKCGAALGEGSAFCPSCGAKDVPKCMRCNAEIAADAKFCPGCGEACSPQRRGTRRLPGQ